jgi:hypothetical protein
MSGRTVEGEEEAEGCGRKGGKGYKGGCCMCGRQGAYITCGRGTTQYGRVYDRVLAYVKCMYTTPMCYTRVYM